MQRFLKFSNRIVNTAYIKYVEIEPDKYTLKFASEYVSGATLFGSGSIESNSYQVFATKLDHPDSYAIIDKWIKSLECASKN